MTELEKDLKNLKNKDKVITEDGVKMELQKRYDGWYVKKPEEYSWKKLDDIKDKIVDIEEYTPTMSYHGSYAFIQSYVHDANGKLVYVELLGQEQDVRSISSLIMLGKTRLKDSYLSSEEISNIQVNTAGNKRLIQSLGNGICHALVYNHNAILKQGFSVLIGKTKDDIYKEFCRWLKQSQPMPYPKELTKELFETLLDRDLLLENRALNRVSYGISEELIKDDYKMFCEIVIELCKKNKLIA